MTKTTYRAMQVSAPGVLELVERPKPRPGKGEVLIEVDACGVCGADAADIESFNPDLHPARIPGHEVVGRITAIGPDVPSNWTLGQRVGVGRKGGHCNECDQCRAGKFSRCRNQPTVGLTCDGGYAEAMLARASGLVSVPEDLSAEEAAPVLCAGIATHNALKKCGADAGDLVAVLGIGGLGHMALQYARNMGFRVAAIGRGHGIADAASKLGAHHYIDTDRENAAEALKRMGSAAAIIATVTNSTIVSNVFPGLAPGGALVILGVGKDPLSISSGFLVGGERSVLGSITGTPWEIEQAMKFGQLTDVRPWIETFPLERANDAYRRMRSGEAKFRVVLTMPTHPNNP